MILRPDGGRRLKHADTVAPTKLVRSTEKWDHRIFVGNLLGVHQAPLAELSLEAVFRRHPWDGVKTSNCSLKADPK